MLKKKIGFVSVSVISVSAILDSVSVLFRCIGKIAFRSYTIITTHTHNFRNILINSHYSLQFGA